MTRFGLSCAIFGLFTCFGCASPNRAPASATHPVWMLKIDAGHAPDSHAQGTLSIELLPSEAPLAVAHLIKLVQAGFYDHQRILGSNRIPRPFMIRFGDPRSAFVASSFFSRHASNPDQPTEMDIAAARKSLDEESARSRIRNAQGEPVVGSSGSVVARESSHFHFVKGTLGFVKTPENTNDAELFITLNSYPFLDDQQTAVGRVIEGESFLDQIGYGAEILESKIQN